MQTLERRIASMNLKELRTFLEYWEGRAAKCKGKEEIETAYLTIIRIEKQIIFMQFLRDKLREELVTND